MEIVFFIRIQRAGDGILYAVASWVSLVFPASSVDPRRERWELEKDAANEEVGADRPEGIAVDALFWVAGVAFDPEVVVGDHNGGLAAWVAGEWGDEIAREGNNAFNADAVRIVRCNKHYDLPAMGACVCTFTS